MSLLPRILADAPRDRPVLIAGPTASGKSALALALAEAQGRVVLNADALQVYGRWQILTARPSDAETRQVPHALFGHVGHSEAYSVGRWLDEVAAVLSEDPGPVIVGGTGLYFSALTEGLAEIPPVPPQLRSEASARIAAVGLGAVAAELDAATRARTDLRNPARVARAWEVLRATGRGLAAWQAAGARPLVEIGAATSCVLEMATDALDARIARRFDLMIAAGALEEVGRELPRLDFGHPSARAIGAAELARHLRGETSLDDARAAAILATRRYAKRQRSWARSRFGAWSAHLAA
ncbi:MAG: hypothetical protein RL123_76 [Pseudomonadota bacterium]